MSKKANSAYEGEHLTPDESRLFKVFYVDRMRAAEFNSQLKRPHPRPSKYYPQTGWYFILLKDLNNHSILGTGAYSSSRKAYLGAMDLLK